MSAIESSTTDIKELKKFGLRGGIVLALIGSLFLWRGVHAYLFFLALSAYNLLGAFLCPKILVPLQKIIFFIVRILGTVVTRVVMFFAFYCVFAPVGIIGRLLKKHFLEEQLDANAKSYWIKREPNSLSKESLERQF